MKRLAILAALLSACATPTLLTKADYIRMSDQEIKRVFLEQMPIGSPREAVERTLKEKFNTGFVNFGHRQYPDKRIFYHYDADAVTRGDKQFSVEIGLGDMTFKSYFASYGWARNFFLAGNYVAALWLFDSEQKLKDVYVYHGSDGV